MTMGTRTYRPTGICRVLAVLLVAALPTARASLAEGAGTPSVGTFLVARQNLPDPNFFETIVVLFAYGESEGAAGLVVNRPTGLSVGDVVSEDGPFAGRQEALYLGGPVAVESILVLQRGADPAEGATPVVGDVYLLADREGLEGVLDGGPSSGTLRFFAGYAGWSPGQLEDEIARGVWHVMAGDPSRVFTQAPREAWAELIRVVFGPRA